MGARQMNILSVVGKGLAFLVSTSGRCPVPVPPAKASSLSWYCKVPVELQSRTLHCVPVG